MKPPSDSPGRQRLLGAKKAAKTEITHVARPLPDDCPVQPLGMLNSRTPSAVYLSGSGVIVELTGQAHGAGNLEALFAPHNAVLWQHWPRHSKQGDVDSFRAELVRADLLAVAGSAGVWDELERVRGAGAWRGRNGELILHLGDRVMVNQQLQKWGVIDGLVYPTSAALLGPAHLPQPGVAADILSMLRSWNWRHPEIAPRLVLGWIVCAMLGGALKWRPALWPTGDRGTGKSTLLDTIKALLGPNAVVSTANTTAAGIRQALMSKALPVLLDELEAQEDGGAAVGAVIELLRQASSGSIGLRGGADHRGQTFQIRSPMLATSIMVPPLRSQDRSRIAVLELLPLKAGGRAPTLSADSLHALGQSLLRRVVDVWPQFDDRLDFWRETLIAFAFQDARGADQYGTLLACADLVLNDQAADADEVQDIIQGRGDTKGLMGMLGELRADDVQDWRRCLDHLLTFLADTYRGGDKLTLGALVARAAGRVGDAGEDIAQASLSGYGLRVVREGGKEWLAIANQHQGLARAFNGTIWAGRSGTSGGWRQTALRTPGAVPRAAPLRFDGLQSRVVLIPLSVALNDDEAA